jgi:LAO/AO transport system kinase
VPVETCSSLDPAGLGAVWETIGRFRAAMTASGELAANRAGQARAWLWSEMAETVVDSLREDAGMQARVGAIEAAVAAGTASPRVAAHELVRIFLSGRGGSAAS